MLFFLASILFTSATHATSLAYDTHTTCRLTARVLEIKKPDPLTVTPIYAVKIEALNIVTNQQLTTNDKLQLCETLNSTLFIFNTMAVSGEILNADSLVPGTVFQADIDVGFWKNLTPPRPIFGHGGIIGAKGPLVNIEILENYKPPLDIPKALVVGIIIVLAIALFIFYYQKHS